MRKKDCIRLMGGIFLAALFAALISCTDSKKAAPEQAKQVYKWKMGTIYNDPVSRPEYNGWGWSMNKFTELVNERTNGQVVVEPYFNSVLGASNELFEQLRRGELEVFYGQPMATVDPRFGAFSIPYIFRDYDEVEKLIANPGAPLFKVAQGWIKDNKGHLLCSGVSVFRGFFNTKHRVGAISDIRDLKARIYEDPVVNLFWKSICNASTIAYSEVYTALQTKAVDGLEFADTSVLSSKYYELGKFFSDIDWQWTWGANIVVAQKAWDELPGNLKTIVSGCAWEAMEVQKSEELASKDKAEEVLKGFGVEFYHLTGQERQTWVDYARSLDSQMREAIGAAAFDEVMNAIKSL